MNDHQQAVMEIRTKLEKSAGCSISEYVLKVHNKPVLPPSIGWSELPKKWKVIWPAIDGAVPVVADCDLYLDNLGNKWTTVKHGFIGHPMSSFLYLKEYQVQKKSYFLWLEDGRVFGQDEKYWKMAEKICDSEGYAVKFARFIGS